MTPVEDLIGILDSRLLTPPKVLVPIPKLGANKGRTSPLNFKATSDKTPGVSTNGL